MNNKFYFIIALGITFCLQFNTLLAQNAASSKGSYSISGQITSTDKKGLEFVSVSIMDQATNKIVGGQLTDNKGNFKVDVPKMGTYSAKIVLVGFEEKSLTNIVVNKQLTSTGTIALALKTSTLNEVVIAEEKRTMTVNMEKKVFNVEKNITTAGGTARDVLENVPSVNVDQDGNVSLRGSGNVLVYINGRPSSINGGNMATILQQIPANTIENIELITNPTAKYDAEGVGGIINIVMKKNKLSGINGMATLGAGTRNKYNAGLNLNYRNEHINLFGNYNYLYNQKFRKYDGYRANFFSESVPYLTQQNFGEDFTVNHSISSGIDIFLNDKNTLTFSGMYSPNDDSSYQNIDYQYLGKDQLPFLYQKRQSLANGNSLNYSATAYYRKTFLKPKKELTSALNYSVNDKNSNNFFTQYEDQIIDPDARQNNFGMDKSTNVSFQVDYVMPIKKDGKTEMGYKTTYRQTDNDFVAENYDFNQQKFINDSNLTNQFVYTEQIHAGYLTYGQKINSRMSYLAGLRAEQTFVTANQVTDVNVFTNNYFSLFPSLNIQYELDKKNQLGLNYSRRINRPGTWNTNPFAVITDPFNIYVGNPYLQPEFINAYEIMHVANLNKGTMSTTLFYRETNNSMTRFKQVDSSGVAVTGWTNANKNNSVGAEWIWVYDLAKWWNINLNASAFYNKYDGTNFDPTAVNDAVSYTAKMISNFKITRGASVQLTSNYRSPWAVPQGRILSMYFTDIAVRKDFMKSKGSLALSVTDVFDTRSFRIEVDGNSFYNSFTWKRESRIAILTFTYRFGKEDLKNMKRRGGDQGSGMDMMF